MTLTATCNNTCNLPRTQACLDGNNLAINCRQDLRKNADFIKLNTYRPEYRSYMLRMWKESADGEWRSSLQNTQTRKTCCFGSLAELIDFLYGVGEDEALAQVLPAELSRSVRVSIPRPAAIIENENQDAR